MRKVYQVTQQMDLLVLLRAEIMLAAAETGERHAAIYLMTQLVLSTQAYKKLTHSAKNDARLIAVAN